MKNVVIIDRDTERTPVVKIEKPVGHTKPKDNTEAKDMVIEDISTVTDGLMTLIRIANDSGYMDADKSASLVVKFLTEAFLTEEETK